MYYISADPREELHYVWMNVLEHFSEFCNDGYPGCKIKDVTSKILVVGIPDLDKIRLPCKTNV